MNQRPLSVTIIGWLYIATGAVAFASQFADSSAWHPLHSDTVLAEFVRLLAVVAGAYMLRGSNWARWLALGWIAFHVVLSAFSSLRQVAIHGLLCAACAYFLLRPVAAAYFSGRAFFQQGS